MVAYRLVDLMGRASAANILGITVRELDKLVEIFEVSEVHLLTRPERCNNLGTRAMGVSKKTPRTQCRGCGCPKGEPETYY